MENITLLKYLIAAGTGSRRTCFDLIKEHRIQVNDKVVNQPLYEVRKNDRVVFDGKRVDLNELVLESVYIILNKPKGYICSLADEEGKPSILRLIRHKNLTRSHIFPVGRLDFLTEGLIFITNDGIFANHILHPRYNVLKEYYVEIKGMIQERHVKQMQKGVYSDNVLYRVKEVRVLSSNEKISRLVLTLNEGKNREIRNIFSILKYKIKLLRRIKIGPFTLDKHLKPGEYKLISKKIICRFMSRFNK
ncbi:MAG: pseudouridine synthase [bacterium]|nr:pseudouridine synthase [bacterium]